MKKYMVLFLILAVILTSFAGCSSGKDSEPASTDDAGDKMKVAFVYHGTVGDFGWFYTLDQAREKTNETLDWVDCQKIENVAVGTDAERIFTELCEDNYKIIVAGSLDYEADILKVAKKYPDVAFLTASGSAYGDNVESFFPRRDQNWYLMGQVAAGLSKTGDLGLVGSLPNQPTIDVILDAWTLGAQSVNPDAKVHVIWCNTFDDPAAERDAALSLIEIGCDVILQGTNNAAHVQASEEMGVYSMSQWEDMNTYGPNTYVGGEKLNWEKYFEEVFPQIRDGEWTGRQYYPDFTKGVASMTDFYIDLPADIQTRLDETKAKLLEDPNFIWEGPIYDSEGNVVVAEGDRLEGDEPYNEITVTVKGFISSVK